MNDTPHDGTWIVIDCENGRELIVRWQAVGRQLAGSWQAVGRQLAGSWQAVGRQLAGSWQAVGVDSLFLGKGHRWITDLGKAGEVPFDHLVSWRSKV